MGGNPLSICLGPFCTASMDSLFVRVGGFRSGTATVQRHAVRLVRLFGDFELDLGLNVRVNGCLR